MIRSRAVFKVQDHDGGIQRQIVFPCDHRVIVGEIALHPGQQLDAVLFRRAEGFGEGLGHAVIRHRDGLMAPFGGPFDEGRGGGYGVHVAHLGVQMQFDPLFFGVIHALGQFAA